MSSWCRRSRVISGVFVAVLTVGDRRGSSCPRAGQEARSEEGGRRQPRRRSRRKSRPSSVSPTRRCRASRRRPTFPIQFQNDFLKAQNARVWVPITLTLDPAKLTTGALTLYLRVAPRGMSAPPPPAPAPDAEDGPEEERQEEGRQAGRRQPPTYPFEDVSFLDLKPTAGSAPAHHARRCRAGRQLRSLRRDARACRGRRDAEGRRAQAAAGRAELLERRVHDQHRSCSPSASTSCSAPVTPDQQSERPYAFGQKEVIVSPDHKFKKAQELIVLFQIYNPTLHRQEVQPRGDLYVLPAGRPTARRSSTAPSLRRSRPNRWAPRSIRRPRAEHPGRTGDTAEIVSRGELPARDQGRRQIGEPRENADAERKLHGDAVAVPRRSPWDA